LRKKDKICFNVALMENAGSCHNIPASAFGFRSSIVNTVQKQLVLE